jgi:hypothetical protein
VKSQPSDIRPLHFLGNFTSDNVICSVDEIISSLSGIKPDAATGPDRIPAIVLRSCSSAIAPSLCSLFNNLLERGSVPKEWKQANITPIHKKGDKKEIANYRPISITSLLSKCLERVVTSRLLNHMRGNGFMNDNQHGFIPGKSCTTLLSSLLDDCNAGLNKRAVKQIDVVTLDWAKAFDSIPHERLLSKLYNYHVRGNTLSWIRSFLNDRTQSVVFGGASSVDITVTSGVPQGCVISPLLFTIFMLDLPACVDSPLLQYADDCTIYREISTLDESSNLQDDLNSINIWCKLNNMALNVSKCAHLQVTRSRVPIATNYVINDIAVPISSSLNMLGVIVSNDLKWNLQTEAVRCKGMRVLGMLARSFGKRKSPSMKVLYTSLVRSLITYGMPAWHPTSVSNIEKLERVQGRASRLILGLSRSDKSLSREERLLHCKLPSIPVLLEKIDLKFLMNCLTGKCHFNLFGTFRISIVDRRPGLRGASTSMRHPLGHTDAYLSSLIPRLVILFNNLPLDLRQGLLPA